MDNERHKDQDLLLRKELKENPFLTPDGYFDSLEHTINGKIAAILKEEEREIMPANSNTPLWVYVCRPIAGLVASFITIFFLGWGILKITDSFDKSKEILSRNDHSVLQNISEEELLKSAFNDYQLEAAVKIISEDTIQISTEEIEEYLINSNISQSSLALLDK